MSIEVFDARPSRDGSAVEIGMWDEQGVCHDCITLSPEAAVAHAQRVLEAVKQILTGKA